MALIQPRLMLNTFKLAFGNRITIGGNETDVNLFNAKLRVKRKENAPDDGN